MNKSFRRMAYPKNETNKHRSVKMLFQEQLKKLSLSNDQWINTEKLKSRKRYSE